MRSASCIVGYNHPLSPMSGTKKKGPVHVALLRGINVGGKNKLPMRDLVTIFDDLGCTEVQTYIQSGNVIYRAPAALAKRIPDLLATAIGERFGPTLPSKRTGFSRAANSHRLTAPSPLPV